MRSAIVGALPITAKMLADDCNIQLHFGSHTFQAGVDEKGGKHLYIPNLPMDDAQAEAMGLGGIVHEDAHFNFTDFDEVALAKSDHEVGEFANVLEDVRVERLECQKYVGAARILEKMTGAAIKEGFYRPISVSMGSLALMGYALYRSRVALLGQMALEPFAVEGAAVLRQAIGTETFDKFDGLVLQVDRCKSTRDVRLLAKEIVAMLRQASEPEGGDSDSSQTDEEQGSSGEESGQSEGQEQQDAPDDASGDQSNTSAEDEPATPGESNEAGGDESAPEAVGENGADDELGEGESDSPEAGGTGDGQESAEGDVADQSHGDASQTDEASSDQSSKSGSGTDEVSSLDQVAEPSGGVDSGRGSIKAMQSSDAGEVEGDKRGTLRALLANQEMESGAFDIGNLLEAYMDSADSEAEQVRLPDVHRADRQVGDVEAILDRIRGETAAIRRVTQGLLEATARNRYCLGKTGKDVDPTQLWKLRCGDTRVFEKRIEGKKQDTSLLILLDNSISMQNRIGIVMDAGLAIALAMESIPGISTCVAAFPYQTKESRDDVLLVSDFGEPLRRTAERFPAVVVQGTTPMAEALLWSSYHILKTRQQRKIICVVTDGQPDNLAATEQVIETLGVAGVEVMALGINTVVNQLFETSETICNVQDVGPALFHMLQEKLAKAA